MSRLSAGGNSRPIGEEKILKPIKLFAAAALFVGSPLCALAQEQANADSQWSFGFGGGIHCSRMSFSKLDKELFPDNNGNLSGVFSAFVRWEFGSQRRFALRPELNFLTRGGKLTGIGREIYDYEEELEDVAYQMKATYLDLRIPVIYQFGRANMRFRPYVYVAPIIGFVTSGRMSGFYEYSDGTFEGVSFEASKSNINSLMIAGAVGVGLNYNFHISGCRFNLGLEVNYQYGFTDTFSSDEKDGKVENTVTFFKGGSMAGGTRKLSGFEVKATLGIPFSIFSRKETPAPVVEPVNVPIPNPPAVVEPVASIPEPEHGCWSLDEIIVMINQGERVEGKKICAIDDINFEFAKSTLNPSSFVYLDKLAEIIKRTGASIRVNGHTDNVGSDDVNMTLSRDRAIAVIEYLVRKGVPSNKLTYAYYGMTRPLESNDTEEGRRINRRVEFEILDK